MTLKTVGMGVVKFLKTKGKVVKQGITAPKTNIPLYTAVGTVAALRHAYEKAKEKSKKKKKDKDKE